MQNTAFAIFTSLDFIRVLSRSHRYLDEDNVVGPVKVRILHGGTISNTATIALQLTDPAVTVTAAKGTFSAIEGLLSPVQNLATFTDPGGAESVTDYPAQVDWGEGKGFGSDTNVTISARSRAG